MSYVHNLVIVIIITNKIIRDVDEMLAGEGLLEAEQLKQLSVKMQQLDGKLKVLSNIDKEILDKCEVDAIEREIDESEAISASVSSVFQMRLHS